MGITKKDAEKHLAYLARRRARYAERKKQQEKPLISIVSGVASWDDEIDLRPAPVVAAVQHALVFTDCPEASPEVAPTPRAPEQLTLPLENRIAQLQPMTLEDPVEIERELRHQRNLEWVREIIARLEKKS